MIEHLGLKWLSETYGIHAVQALRIESQVGTARKTRIVNGYAQETFPAAFRPSPDLAGHLTFALKYEGLHLEFLARLFKTLDPQALLDWIKAEPTGAYARRAGFLYEWLTGTMLDCPDTATGNYVDAISADDYFTATRPVTNKRWRVRNNLPGTVDFCPVIHRYEQVKLAEQFDCAAALHQLEIEYGQDVILRGAVWLTIKESRASFAIEREEQQTDRIQRFASVMESRCGQASDPLAPESLGELQQAILGDAATRYGLRRSPVFVGHSSGYNDVVDYIAPHWEATAALLRGLGETLTWTVGQASIVRAAVASFGFVYIHPMSDGNGRISRFLVNDILRRDGAVPAPFILPISATITNTAKARAGYDQSLAAFSKPLLRKYAHAYRFAAIVTHGDGIESNFHFSAWDDALPAWRYPDLTSHVEYLGGVVRQTIEEEMDQEARYIRSVHTARRGIKNSMEGPDTDIDRIIRAVRDNNWAVSNKLKKEFPLLGDSALADRIASIVHDAFAA